MLRTRATTLAAGVALVAAALGLAPAGRAAGTSWRAALSASVTGLDGAAARVVATGAAPVVATALAATAGSRHVVRVQVRGEESSVGRRVRLVVGGVPSAPVTLEPWWQTVAVTATATAPTLPVELRGIPGGEAWQAGQAFTATAASGAAIGPTEVRTAGRVLLVNGQPYTVKGMAYMPAAVGGTPYALTWNEPLRCQSDAQLLRVAGVNTLRIPFLPELYDASSYQQCMDAFYGNGLRVIWLIQPPGGAQYNVPAQAFVEAYWQVLQRGIDAVGGHPATLAWNIGNEINYTTPDSGGWWPQVDELARRAKARDPHHVTTTTLSVNQFVNRTYGGVRPGWVPHIDMWGMNAFRGRNGYDGIWWAAANLDPTRPVWLSEYGVDRYRCVHPDSYGLTCGAGSGEDPHAQAVWNSASWQEIAAHLAPGDPGGVIGGVAFMWSDVWWFALGFAGAGTPVNRDVSGVYNGWSKDHQPDGHQSSEFYGITHAALYGTSGPRVTTEAYDALASLYTGTPGPTVGGLAVSVQGCAVTVDFASATPTFGRVDWGPVVVLATSGLIESDTALMQNSAQGATASTAHRFRIGGLLPATTYEIHARGFDGAGRPGSPNPVRVTTSPTCL